MTDFSNKTRAELTAKGNKAIAKTRGIIAEGVKMIDKNHPDFAKVCASITPIKDVPKSCQQHAYYITSKRG